MANLLRLPRNYLNAQIERCIQAAVKIAARSEISAGRVIPVGDDLPIHAGRRIEAAVMFLDICKFSSRPASTAAEQEVLLRILSLFFSEMIRIVEDYGGCVEKNTGDGLMAYFTRNATTGEAAQHTAVAAALTMFSAAEMILNPLISSAGLVPLEFRICIDHGPITVARVGAAQRFNGMVAIGATANIACKMLAAAGPNTLLVGDAVLPGLPGDWVQNWVQLESADTGWIHTPAGVPYRFWRYNGRWTTPE